MKHPHSPFSRDEIDINLESIKKKLSENIDRVEELGEDRQRIEFFDALRDLIREKDAEGDSIAVEVLSWAYEKLSST
jgi:hypothetical protein